MARFINVIQGTDHQRCWGQFGPKSGTKECAKDIVNTKIKPGEDRFETYLVNRLERKHDDWLMRSDIN